MNIPSKVLWGEGLFLRPQHFQQQDRYHEARLNETANALHPYCWGVRRLAIDTDALRRGLSLAQVIGARIKLSRRGDEWIGPCHFHAERTPSFTVNDAKGFYHCFGCGAHGDVIRFIADYHRLDFRAACALLGAADRSPPSPHPGWSWAAPAAWHWRRIPPARG